MPATAPMPSVWPSRWQRFSSASVRGFHVYGGWLVGISWKRFFVLSVLLLVAAALLSEIPPFSWTYTTHTVPRKKTAVVVNPPSPPAPPAEPGASAPRPSDPDLDALRKLERLRKLADGVDIQINDKGVHITTRPRSAASAASAASGATGSWSAAGATAASAGSTSASSSSASGGSASASASGNDVTVNVSLPPGADSAEVREAVEEARQAIEEAVREATEATNDAKREAANTRKAHGLTVHVDTDNDGPVTRRVRFGEFLPTLAMFWILASMILKITYKRQIAAEAQAAQAVETAEAESLKRQVVEARMAAMQAQVEPHFLFNTLASIDHLIEVDPPRASQMQKNLIALLRASMPTMREAADVGQAGPGAAGRDLGRELAVIRPYLEILKVRMEERLTTAIDVPDGLLSAEFPAMMIQTLVENAIKHGLEPKPEGGQLTVRAEIVHGKLAVTVADTGLGFGRAATAGTGVGLANIRERLALLYGTKASVTIAENPGGGTRVTIAVPYKPVSVGDA